MYDGVVLRPGHTLAGPALVDGTRHDDVDPGRRHRLRVDAHGTLVMELDR